MASDHEAQAKDAFIDDHFELAVDLYSQAIALNPHKPQLFIHRAQANIKLAKFTQAVSDSNKAIELDKSNPKAYFRKGTACIKLEEYQTAKVALQIGASLAPEDSRFASLINQCDKLIAEEEQQLVEKPASASVELSNEVKPWSDLSNNMSTVVPKPKFRHEFYQKPGEVVVTIFARGVQAKNVVIEFGEQILSVSIIEVPGEDAYHFQPRLFGKILPAECRFEILHTKIEIRLAKAEPLHWASLEFSNVKTVPQKITTTAAAGYQRPSYPSSKPQRVNWDKLEAEVKREEKEEKLDGDAGLNKFFREIFQDGDEDMRRAMSKSFVESKGTVLSTNWKEVGSKKVEASPPDGMEMKKWEH